MFGGGEQSRPNLIERAEQAERLGFGSGAREPGRDECVGSRREMKLDLLVRLDLDATAPDRQAQRTADARGQHRRVPLGPLRCVQDARHRFRIAVPARGLIPQLGATHGCDAVVSGAPVVLGDTPIGGDGASLLEPIKRLIECTVDDIEVSGSPGFDPGGDLETVHWPPGEGLEHEHVERSPEHRQRL